MKNSSQKLRDRAHETLGWAAIVYSVHDVYTFGALVVLIAGELAITQLSKRKRADAADH
jgi:hypothetical protein